MAVQFLGKRIGGQCGFALSQSFALFAVLLVGCQSNRFEPPPAWELGGQTSAYHEGPLVAAGDEGPRRYLPALMAAWDSVADGQHSILPGAQWPSGWAEIGGGDAQVWWLAAEDRSAARTVVLHVEAEGPAKQVLLHGMRAWTEAQEVLQILPPKNNLVFCVGSGSRGLEQLRAQGLEPYAWITVSERGDQATTLFRGPDPMVPGSHAPGHGLVLVMRLAFVDVGLVTRPWKSLERVFDGAPLGQHLAAEGLAHVRIQLGASGTNLSRSDEPSLDDDERTALVVWSGLQCLLAGYPSDLDRYLDSLKLEMRFRVNQDEGKLAEPWKDWIKGARLWLRELALGLPAQ